MQNAQQISSDQPPFSGICMVKSCSWYACTGSQGACRQSYKGYGMSRDLLALPLAASTFCTNLPPCAEGSAARLGSEHPCGTAAWHPSSVCPVMPYAERRRALLSIARCSFRCCLYTPSLAPYLRCCGIWQPSFVENGGKTGPLLAVTSVRASGSKPYLKTNTQRRVFCLCGSASVRGGGGIAQAKPDRCPPSFLIYL